MSGLNELVSETFRHNFGRTAEHLVAYTTMAQAQIVRDVPNDAKEGRRRTDQYAAYAITWFDHVFAEDIADMMSMLDTRVLAGPSQTFRVLYVLAYELSTHTTTNTTAHRGAALSAYERFMGNVHRLFTRALELHTNKLKQTKDYKARIDAASRLLLYGQEDALSITHPGYVR